MSDDRYSVRLLSKAGEIVEGVFVLDEDEASEQISLRLESSLGNISRQAFDYFEATCLIRHELELSGWRPVCYGSSCNVYPSGMCRDMGMGLKAYKLQLGKAATMGDLVSIFDSSPDIEPVSVGEQRSFWQEWLRSVEANP